jgi:WD40 repeat protein
LYLESWSLPSGRRLSSTRVGYGFPLTSGLVDRGARLIVVWAGSAAAFDTRSLRRVRTVPITPTATPGSAAISPDGRTVVIGSQTGRVSFIDLSSGVVRRGVGGHGALVSNVVYSPDGHTVTTTGNDGKVIVWDPDTATPVEVLSGPVAQAGGVALSTDGRTLYTYSVDGVVLAWDLAGNRRFGLRFHLGPGLRCCGPVSPPAPPLAVSPDGSRFAVRLGASTVGLFSAKNLQRQASFTLGPKGAVITSLAWSPSGSELAAGGYSGLVQLWNLAGAPRLTRTFVGLHAISTALPEAIQSVAFSPDGRLLVASDETETPPQSGLPPGTRQTDLAIWQASIANLVTERLGLGLVFPPGGSDVLAFSRDGKLLAVSQSPQGGAASVLDVSTLQTRRTLPPLGGEGTVSSLAFAPDGTLATGTSGGTVQLWNPTSGEPTAHPILAALTPITSTAFDATGQHFATTGAQDGEVKLWFTSTLQQDGATLATERSATYTAALEPDSGNLLVVDDHGNAFTWSTSPAAWEQRACAIAGRNLTRQEWAQFVPGQDYARVCP